MLLTLPEIIIRDLVDKAIRLLKKDYENQTNEENSMLYQLFADSKMQRYKLFEQSKVVFLKEKDDPRYINVNLMFDRDRQGPPTIHILLPSESQVFEGIGVNEGYKDFIEDEYGNFKPVYTRRYRSEYNIVITSDNVNEVILIYHVVRALLTSLVPTFNANCIQNIKLSGRELTLNSELVPTHMHMRAITMNFEYESSSTDFDSFEGILDATFEGIILLEDDESVSEI